MGCVNSKTDINDTHPNVFEVMNVDEVGRLISPGQLELTDTELILYQKGKSATHWPLKSLRKYGFDFEIFSFECGRRCPTGPGIYAFRCQRAEQLFNMLQQNIQLRNIVPTVQSRPSYPLSEGTNSVRKHPNLNRTDSHNSNGPNSPSTPPISSPPPDLLSEHNNNKNLIDSPQPPYTNILGDAMLQNDISNASSSTTTNSGVLPAQNEGHCYMNVDTNTKDLPNDLLDVRPIFDFDDGKPLYANIDVSNSVDVPQTAISSPISVAETPTYITVREVNYAELDLVPSKADNLQTPDSPNKPNKSYVTIDFKKTNALSQSVNPSIDIEEGSRKTRHNSTISDVTTRHSNSLSD